MREVSAHYLRHNQQTRMPRRHIFLDTEARITHPDGVQRQEWLCGAAEFYDCDPRRKEATLDGADYLDPARLWVDVDAFTRDGSRTVLWAHNLAYDLRIADALGHLPALGWSLRAIVLDGQACWARFVRDRRSLVCTDLTAWFACPLAHIGVDLGIEQKPLPADPTDTTGLLRRCRRDVEILRRAVLWTFTYIESGDLGNWQMTGAGQAWSAYRHRFMHDKLLVHTDQRALEAERRAIWAGRTECWRHGTYEDAGLVEYDLPRAYATVARDVEIPTVLLGSLPRIRRAQFDEWWPKRRLLCNVRVTTDRPLVPAEHDGRIVWPVGTFSTTLWDNEVRLLLRWGAKVRFGKTWVYSSAQALYEWASWILRRLDEPREVIHPLERRLLKHWSRALIGRFALRYRQWETFGTADQADLALSAIVGPDHAPGAKLMQVGTDLLELGAMVDSENALPQVTGYVTAECRCRLWDLIDTAGFDQVFYMDTDSLIVTQAGAADLDRRIALNTAYGLRRAHQIRRLELRGPRNITADDELRASGIPKKAQRLPDGRYLGVVWEGLGHAVESGHAQAVLVYERSFRLNPTDRRRRWIDGGHTRPIGLPEGAPVAAEAQSATQATP
jgi:hypothetical protein